MEDILPTEIALAQNYPILLGIEQQSNIVSQRK